MARQSIQPNSPGPTPPAPARESGAKIPDKPRDCAPTVDTWPILDEAVGKAPKQKAGDSAVGKTAS
jgi:hypothetical protein